jgi:hypothetical protein
VAYGTVRGPAPDFPPSANKFVGILERSLMTTFVVLGQFALVPLVALPRLVFQGRHVMSAHPTRAMPYVAELLASVALAVAIGLWLRRL